MTGHAISIRTARGKREYILPSKCSETIIFGWHKLSNLGPQWPSGMQLQNLLVDTPKNSVGLSCQI
ncbi:4801_t:CDS:2 [Acaulospora morrowiae]|uniref:4801_t:CDS:1 n=1 Tax=Acaulospora morrowiae TaxID=94023 RepID=A0A9N8V6H2_9GLOM|nr:4801_t:CDS:2 [Acaulospora morrowiae]